MEGQIAGYQAVGEAGTKTIPVSELKAHFSDILRRVGQGEKSFITFDRRKNRVAALVPFHARWSSKEPRTLGVLADRGPVSVSKDFELTDEEFLLEVSRPSAHPSTKDRLHTNRYHKPSPWQFSRGT